LPGESLDEVVVFHKDTPTLDLGIYENVHQWEGVGAEGDAGVLYVKLLEFGRIAQRVVGRLPVHLYSCVQFQVAAKVDVLIRQLRIHKKLGYLHGAFAVFQQRGVYRPRTERHTAKG